MRKISKKLEEARKKVDSTKNYSLADAIKLAKETSYTKFDGSIDLAFNLNLDVRQADQQLRGSITLPNGIGKKTVVLVATDDAKFQKEAEAAKADMIMGAADLDALFKKGKFDFDVMVTEPKMMAFLGKYGKLLGPKGLMPNPKTGTVTMQIGKTVEEIKKGKANYRTDKGGVVHSMIGKVSMTEQQLIENADTLIQQIKRIKPAAVKGTYMKGLSVSASMGPSVKIDVSGLNN